jgi:hypothetical protein
MDGRAYDAFLERLRRCLLDPSGRLPVAVRTEIVEGRIVEEPLNAFVVRVRGNASSVTQAHIDELKTAGFSEDQIFEATVCAAYRAGVERWQAAQQALQGAK